RPFEQHRPEIFQGVIRAEDVEENLVDYLESQRHAERGCAPISKEIEVGHAQQIGRKKYGENKNLGNDVSEEVGETAVQLTAEHEGRHHQLQAGMGHPESQQYLLF